MEKESVLNSYKLFLKSCNFNFQILIQSKKENLSKHFFILEQEKNKKNTKEEIYNNYFKFIKNINSNNKSSSKNFYIIVNQESEFLKNNPKTNTESISIEKLNEKYFKIKETLTRCGNFVYEVNKDETLQILFSFFNKRKSIKY